MRQVVFRNGINLPGVAELVIVALVRADEDSHAIGNGNFGEQFSAEISYLRRAQKERHVCSA